MVLYHINPILVRPLQLLGGVSKEGEMEKKKIKGTLRFKREPKHFFPKGELEPPKVTMQKSTDFEIDKPLENFFRTTSLTC